MFFSISVFRSRGAALPLPMDIGHHVKRSFRAEAASEEVSGNQKAVASRSSAMVSQRRGMAPPARGLIEVHPCSQPGCARGGTSGTPTQSLVSSSFSATGYSILEPFASQPDTGVGEQGYSGAAVLGSGRALEWDGVSTDGGDTVDRSGAVVGLLIMPRVHPAKLAQGCAIHQMSS